MRGTEIMDRKTEIRKLPPSAVFKLGQILDIGNAWQQVMAVIPQDPRDINSEAKYSLEHMKLIESAGEKQGRSCTEILLDEWGTSGQTRPTIETLLEVLLKAQFYRAAEFVAVELLHDSPPPRPPDGPAAEVDLNLDAINVLPSELDVGELNRVFHVPYADLERTTNNFDDTPLTYVNSVGVCQRIGYKLGTGAFGSVYFGQLSNGREVAVKKLTMNAPMMKKQFINEIVTLSEFQHENLVPLLAFSCDTDNYCLVYEFMSNGSLLDRLKVKNSYPTGENSLMLNWLGTGVTSKVKSSYPTGETNLVLNGMASYALSSNVKPLEWKKRIDIAVDICRGINFLHTHKETPVIHRDIKTANVLLDDQLKAKVGDFGLVKVKPNTSSSKLLTSTVFGTSAYMAPEAFRGDVSVKMDVFSFGVVLLELLTGLPPYDEERNGCDLVTYIDEVVEDKIEFLLDKNAGNWSVPMAEEIFQLSQACLQEKRYRPVIQEVLQQLETFQSSVRFQQ